MRESTINTAALHTTFYTIYNECGLFMTIFLIFNLQLSGVQAFINLSIIAILSHALERKKELSAMFQVYAIIRQCVWCLRWQVCGTDQF